MRETIKDWKMEWIETNGETDEVEVVIKDSNLDDFAPYVYEGSFVDIPEELYDRKVISCGRIENSSVLERNGAYSLTI